MREHRGHLAPARPRPRRVPRAHVVTAGVEPHVLPVLNRLFAHRPVRASQASDDGVVTLGVQRAGTEVRARFLPEREPRVAILAPLITVRVSQDPVPLPRGVVAAPTGEHRGVVDRLERIVRRGRAVVDVHHPGLVELQRVDVNADRHGLLRERREQLRLALIAERRQIAVPIRANHFARRDGAQFRLVAHAACAAARVGFHRGNALCGRLDPRVRRRHVPGCTTPVEIVAIDERVRAQSFRLGVCVPTVHPRVDDARGFDDRGGGVRPASSALALVHDVAKVDAIGPVEVNRKIRAERPVV